MCQKVYSITFTMHMDFVKIKEKIAMPHIFIMLVYKSLVCYTVYKKQIKGK